MATGNERIPFDIELAARKADRYKPAGRQAV